MLPLTLVSMFATAFALPATPESDRLRNTTAVNRTTPCSLPLAYGNCRAYVPRFYFDSDTGRCESFIYTGCGGNDNNFGTTDDCLETCDGFVKTNDSVTTGWSTDAPLLSVNNATSGPASNPIGNGTPTTETCHLPPVNNPQVTCEAYIPSWTYDGTSGTCQPYIYGGCGKTANLFQSESDCRAACGHLITVAKFVA